MPTSATFAKYLPGETPSVWIPGDFILTSNLAPWHSRDGFVSAGIRQAQRHRYKGEDRKFCHWNHAAYVTGDMGILVEALAHGVEITHADKYTPREYHVVHPDLDPEGRDKAVKFALDKVGDEYAYLAILSVAFALQFNATIQFTEANTLFCSGLVASALTAGGIIFKENPTWVVPAGLGKKFDVVP